MAERPEYLTVPEVMARLRLSRTTVYEHARLYLATNGAVGLPCRRFGRSLRFPAAAFDTAIVEVPPANESGADEPAGTRRRDRPHRPSRAPGPHPRPHAADPRDRPPPHSSRSSRPTDMP
jgi:hypothetical protein